MAGSEKYKNFVEKMKQYGKAFLEGTLPGIGFSLYFSTFSTSIAYALYPEISLTDLAKNYMATLTGLSALLGGFGGLKKLMKIYKERLE
jgi:hypothetical protein